MQVQTPVVQGLKNGREMQAIYKLPVCQR